MPYHLKFKSTNKSSQRQHQKILNNNYGIVTRKGDEKSSMTMELIKPLIPSTA